MKKDVIAALGIILMLLFVAIGCRPDEPQATQNMGRHIMAASGELTLSHMDYLSKGGAFLMFSGVIAVAIGKRLFGGTLFVGGGAMLGYFTYLSEMPWMIAAMITLAAAVFVIWLWQTGRLRGTLKEAVAAIQPHDEVKAGMGGGDLAKQEKIRKVIAPLKEELRKEGKLEKAGKLGG